MTYTKEPWVLFTQDGITEVQDAQELAVVSWMGFDRSGRPKETNLSNARRIVACVNACAGLATESLESDALSKLINEFLAANTELLVALKLALNSMYRSSYNPTKTEPMEIIEAAIAKAGS